MPARFRSDAGAPVPWARDALAGGEQINGDILSKARAAVDNAFSALLGLSSLKMTNAEVDTHVVLADRTMHFQEWWTRHRARLEPEGFENAGIDTAPPASGVVEAIRAGAIAPNAAMWNIGAG